MRAPVAAPARLRVAVQATDAARLGALVRILHAAGHAVTATAAEADAMLLDLAADEPPASAGGLPIVLLTDNEALAADPEQLAVLPRAATAAQVDAALRAAAAGLLVRARDLPPAFSDSFTATDDGTAAAPLTPREVDILTVIGEGMSNKQAARALGISAHTVKFHLEAIFGKLGAANRAEAVAKGLRRRLIEI